MIKVVAVISAEAEMGLNLMYYRATDRKKCIVN
jgi:hypothetical protein